ATAGEQEVGRSEPEAVAEQLLGIADRDHHAAARVGGRAGAVSPAEGARVRAERELLDAQARLQRQLDVAAVAAPGERRFTSGRIAAAHRPPRSGPCASTPTGSGPPRASSRPDRRRRPRSTAGRTRGTPPADRGP